MSAVFCVTYFSVEVEIAEDHKHSADFGEQRPKNQSEAKRQKIRTALEIHDGSDLQNKLIN